MKTRLITTIVLAVGAFILPWPVVFAGCLISFVVFDFYLEGLLAVFLLDLLYAAPTDGWWSWQFSLTLIGLVLLAFIEYTKRHLTIVDNPFRR
ncbi:MAG: hypothetical protein WDZ85_03590 [Candidatus Paceibacterota bacterium]